MGGGIDRGDGESVWGPEHGSAAADACHAAAKTAPDAAPSQAEEALMRAYWEVATEGLTKTAWDRDAWDMAENDVDEPLMDDML